MNMGQADWFYKDPNAPDANAQPAPAVSTPPTASTVAPAPSVPATQPMPAAESSPVQTSSPPAPVVTAQPVEDEGEEEDITAIRRPRGPNYMLIGGGIVMAALLIWAIVD